MTHTDKLSEFGFLTLATKNDILKAIGLYYSLKKIHPSIPVAIACTSEVEYLARKHFDIVILQNTSLRGFEHKVNLDKYTPFNKTLFLDADILVFRDLLEIINKWSGSIYAVRGTYRTNFISAFGLDSNIVLKKIDKPQLVNLGGAGHGYFELPQAEKVFDKAREITNNYEHYANKCKYADEDVIGIALTILDIPPKLEPWFQSRIIHALKGTINVSSIPPHLSFVAKETKDEVNPYFIHFAVKEGPFIYRKLLSDIYKDNEISMGYSLWKMALKDYFTVLKWKLKTSIKKLFT